MANTSLIYGNFKDSKGNALANAVVSFVPIDTPKKSSSDIVTSQVVTVTLNGSGQFGYVGNTPYPFLLVEGAYRVVVSDRDVFTIVVPGDGSTNEIGSLAQNLGDPTQTLGGTGIRVSELNDVMTEGVATVVNQGRAVESSLKTRYYFLAETDGTSVLAQFQPLFESLNCYAVVGMNLNPGGSALTIDANIGQFFHDYIGSYSGSYGPGAGVNNKFLYATGAADWIPGNPGNATGFFNLPNNERYYKQVFGFGDAAVTFFVLSSNPAEPDGTTIGSTQHTWFAAEIAASTTRWNVVVFRDAMRLSVTGYSNLGMDWNWESYNVHAIICGGSKFYERLTYGSALPVFVVGGMHVSPTPFGATAAGSEVRYNTLPTLFTMLATPGALLFTAINSYGTIVDTWGVQGELDSKIRVDVNLKTPGSLFNDLGALEVLRGLAESQVLPGGFSNFRIQQEGRIVHADTVPTAADVQANPFLKKCFVVVGDDPPRMWYWHKSRKSWQPWGYSEQGSSPYFGVAPLKLNDVTFTPAALDINNPVLVVHLTHPVATEIWYSIDGGPWEMLTTAVEDRVVLGAYGRVRVVSAYASRSGYRDSEIASVELMTPFA